MIFKKHLCWLFLATAVFSLLSPFPLSAQVDNRLPFRQRVGNPAPENNIFRIKGDFTIIGNTNLTLETYGEEKQNSLDRMVFVDVDQEVETANSSSATLVFSQENGADPSCSDILYAGLYWSGRAKDDLGMNFEILQGYLPGIPEPIDDTVQQLKEYDSLSYSNYFFFSYYEEDDDLLAYPRFFIRSAAGFSDITFDFRNTASNQVRYAIGEEEMKPVTGLEITKTDSTLIATFDPITFSENGINFSVEKIIRTSGTAYGTYNSQDNSLEVAISGALIPQIPQIKQFDKRKVKIKGPNASDYTEVTAGGNQILYPNSDLRSMYVGYADVTSYVKAHGTGEYTLADLALTDGMGDNTGNYGHWGLIVVYQNPKMYWRDVTVFDGYAFVQSLNTTEQTGEIAIEGFETVKQGPVNLKLGVMAGEGDRTIQGDFLEIINQNGEWTRLHHPLNSIDNFFNSSIYTPVTDQSGVLVQNPRYPNLLNNTGIDIIQWEIPNPDNSIIGNNQTSTRFRFGTKQDIYNIYSLAFSVRSYLPDLQALNKLESINNASPGVTPSAKPGEEISFNLEIRNRGEEETKDTQFVIPLPYFTTFVRAETTPAGFGSITFDPDRGAAGSIIWDVGEIPVATNPEDLIASMQYTLQVTDDCSILANNQCEANISIRGGIYGTGKNSESTFANIPFIQDILSEGCEGKEVQDPLEIALSGFSEFVQAHCGEVELLSGLGPIHLPDFCQGESPVDLGSLIRPTHAGFSIFFFSAENSDSPLYEYSVNTSIIGTETVWVAEGPTLSCTGIRVPVVLNVIPRSASPIVSNQQVCNEGSVFTYGVYNMDGYQQLYYPDNNPDSEPFTTIPTLEATEPGTYSVWVSQVREGACESRREEVKIAVRDCSLFPEISVRVIPDKEVFSVAGEVVTFILEVENTGNVPLTDVSLGESRSGNYWQIPQMEAGEILTFTATYTVTLENIVSESLHIYAEASGFNTQFGSVYDDDYATIYLLPKGFLDHQVASFDENCPDNGPPVGKIELKFLETPQSGSYLLVRQEDGDEIRGEFSLKKTIPIEVPVGTYLMTLIHTVGFEYPIKDIFEIRKKDNVEFDVPTGIDACLSYNFTPDSAGQLDYILQGPDGAILRPNQSNSYELLKSGTYTLSGSDPTGEKCQQSKTFQVTLKQPANIPLEMVPFCGDDAFTTIQLDTQGLLVNWFLLEAGVETPLPWADGYEILFVDEEGEYMVTLTDSEGCLVGKGQTTARRSTTSPPPLDHLYSICTSKKVGVTLEAGADFPESIWYLDDQIVSTAPLFSVEAEGSYTLVATDIQGCEHRVSFEVEDKCKSTMRYPNAIVPGDPEKAFVIFPDNLIEWLEVSVQNRWGELIYYCQDSNPISGKASACFWDGTISGNRVMNGSYSLQIRYGVKGQGEVVLERGSITVID